MFTKRLLLQLLALACLSFFGNLAQAQEICAKFGTKSVDGGKYKIQNNIWGASTPQCIKPVNTRGFRVTKSGHKKGTTGAPSAYPSIWRGCHWKDCTSGSGMPVKASDVNSAKFTWSFNVPSNGIWNAAAEAWFKKTASLGQPDGTEILLWLNDRGGLKPFGNRLGTVNLEGAKWEVFYSNPGWHFLIYRRIGKVTSASINMVPFMNDAANRGKLNKSWYLMDMEAGFEVWNGGVGLQTNNFTFNVTKKSGGGSPGNDECNNKNQCNALYPNLNVKKCARAKKPNSVCKCTKNGKTKRCSTF